MSRPLSSESVFRALAHPTRRAIIVALRHGESAAGQILHNPVHTKATLSDHLRALHHCGLVTFRGKCTKLIYGLNVRALRPVEQFLGSIKPPV